MRDEVNITDQEHVRSMFEMFCKEVGTIPVGVAARSSLLSLSMGEKLLRLHMTKEADIPKAQGIAKFLSKGFHFHGYPVGRKEAKEINLPIADPNPKVEDLMWRIWLDIERELMVRQPFSHQHVLMNSKEAPKLLKPAPQLNLPANAPPETLQQILEDMLKASVEMIEPVDYEVVTARLESTRHATREVLRGKILAYRTPTLDLQINGIKTYHQWESVNT
jgi:hypothetical protein